MPFTFGKFIHILLLAALLLTSIGAQAQTGNAGTVRGNVTDPSGAVIPGATIHLTNSSSGLDRSTTTDASGQFVFSNVPFNPYQLTVSAAGFSSFSQSAEIRSVVGINLKLVLQIAGGSQTVTVEASGDLG